VSAAHRRPAERHGNRLVLLSAAAVWGVAASCLEARSAETPGANAAPSISFEYDQTRPVEVRGFHSWVRDGVTLRDIDYAAVSGRNAATLVLPPPDRPGPYAAVLFVHWFAPEFSSSNRTQFFDEAVELARLGTVSLLIDTPWGERGWFERRDSKLDYANSVAQVKELRRAFDVLLAQERLDPKRVGLVGHDFGAMYGALAVATDPRPKVFVFIAGTQSFSDWFLYLPKREEGARARFVSELAPLDPVKYLPKIAPRPVMLQFGRTDFHVKRPAAEALASAAEDPKTVKFYEAGHELNEAATRDRQAWLMDQLGLR
jgi:dienelactone hydrolase